MFRHALVAAIATILSLPAGADFDSAVAAYEKKQFESAYNEFRRLAELGDAPSQRNLAAMYARGEHVEKDLEEAWAWAALAASKDSDTSATLRDAIGKRLGETGLATAQARATALQQRFGSEALSERLFPVVSERLPDCTVDVMSSATPVHTTPPSYPMYAARERIEGFACASFYLSAEGIPTRVRIYDQGAKDNDTGKPVKNARPFVEATTAVLPKWRFVPPATAALRQIPARYCLDFKLEGMSRSEAKAEQQQFDQQKDLALQGNPSAQYRLALQLESWSGQLSLTKSKRQELKTNAKTLFLHSAVGGEAQSQFRLARDLLTGNQCEKDIGKGIAWLTFAAQQGHTESQYLLASRLEYGEGVEPNEAKAAKWLKAAAEGGHARAKIEYALYLLRTEPGRRNEVLALLPETPDENDLLQLEAAALGKALAGDFAAAVNYQQQGLAIAEEVGLESASRTAVLARYQAQQLPDLKDARD